MKCWLRKGLAMEGLAGRGAVPYPNCRRAMPSLPRGRQARHTRPLVASVFTAASAQNSNELPVVISSKLSHRRGDRSPPPTPRTTADHLDPRPTRGGLAPLRRPGRRPSLGPRRKGAATAGWRRRRRASFRREAHTCPRGTCRAPRARRGPRARRILGQSEMTFVKIQA